MTFLNSITGHPQEAILRQWYDDLGGPNGCPIWFDNLEQCGQFPDDREADLDNHLADFAGRLPAHAAHSPKPRGQRASNEEPARLVARGKPSSLADPVVRFQPVSAVLRYNVDERVYGSRDVTEFDEFLRTHPDGIETAIRPLLRPGTIRSYLRITFWASKPDIDNFRASHPTARAGECRLYLGIDDNPPGPGPMLLLRLSDAMYPRHVPTGFDAFDFPAFLPQVSGATVGKAQNIIPTGRPGAGHPNSNEIVTPETDVAHVKFLEIIDP